jgi:hypothetical protein
MKSMRKITLLAVLPFIFCFCGCLFDTGGDSGDGGLRIEGYVKDLLSKPVPDVTIKAYLIYADALAAVSTCSTKTNSGGFYRIGFDDAVVEIIVRPDKSDCVFRPPQISYYSPGGPLRNENFTAFCGILHSISGHVVDTRGDPVVGVAVTIRDDVSHWSKTVFSGGAGLYLIRDVVPGAAYAVTPFLSGYNFDPPRRVYENLAQDFEGQDFVASELPGDQSMREGTSSAWAQ